MNDWIEEDCEKRIKELEGHKIIGSDEVQRQHESSEEYKLEIQTRRLTDKSREFRHNEIVDAINTLIDTNIIQPFTMDETLDIK